MRVGSLFSGIGGFDLGFEWAGWSTQFFVEQDPFCQAVLRKHWPEVPIFDDVRQVGAEQLPDVDVVCGGFPCQDISVAGRGAGIGGARSGLWGEYARLIGELRPRYVIVENVSALLARGMERVLGDLASLGYDAEWDCIPASAVGAPHQRDRVWIVAYPRRSGRRQDPGGAHGDEGTDAGWSEGHYHFTRGAGPQWVRAAERGEVGHSNGARPQGHGGHDERADERASGTTSVGAGDVPDADGPRQNGRGLSGGDEPGGRSSTEGGGSLADPELEGSQGGGGSGATSGQREAGRSERSSSRTWWVTEPDVGRVANGVPARVDRLKSLGNALVPQIAEWIAWQINYYEGERR